jgi:hypothetical protein
MRGDWFRKESSGFFNSGGKTAIGLTIVCGTDGWRTCFGFGLAMVTGRTLGRVIGACGCTTAGTFFGGTLAIFGAATLFGRTFLGRSAGTFFLFDPLMAAAATDSGARAIVEVRRTSFVGFSERRVTVLPRGSGLPGAASVFRPGCIRTARFPRPALRVGGATAGMARFGTRASVDETPNG